MRHVAFAFALFSAILWGQALADGITVHNTGVDASDALVAAGAPTSFWALSSAPAGATQSLGSTPYRFYNGAYFADTTGAAWVSPGADGNAGVQGDYVYDLVIDLGATDPATASISGTFGTDNDGAIWLNDDAAAATTGSDGFTTPTPFTINSGFVAGVNTLHLKVNNAGDPTAFFVSFSNAPPPPPTYTLFTNWSGSIVGGNLWTAGGPCSSACFAIGDNFSNAEGWVVTQVTVYVVVSYTGVVQGGGWRYALFTQDGTQVVAPTDTAVAFTYLGNFYESFDIYKGVISGLDINLPAGAYQFRFTNTQTQGVYPAYGSSTSAQTIAPGFVQYTGSPEVEALLGSPDQRSEEWAFEIAGRTAKVLEIAPATLDFGSLVANTTSGVAYVTLTNPGSTQVTVSALTTASAPFQQTADGTCGGTLPIVIAANSACTLSYTFTPTAQDVASQIITVTSDAAGNPAFELTGRGDTVFADGFEP